METGGLSFDDRRAMVYEDWSAGKITRVRADEMLRVIGEQEAQTRRDVGTGQPALSPRCAVCGGPFADGSGCEFCPKVGL